MTAPATPSDAATGGRGMAIRVDGDGIATVTIDRPGARVNVMDVRFIEELEQAVASLAPDLRGLIVASSKERTFVAGADLRQMVEAPTAGEAAGQVRRLQRTLHRLATLPYPSVAAINGAALGGGFELALACDYRVCVEGDAPILGLPEVRLGLIPAGGGCQRLPRLVGLTRGLALILEARQVSPRRALRLGLVDEVVHPAVLDQAARAWLTRGKRRDHPGWSRLDRAAAQWTSVRRLIYVRAARTVRSKSGRHYPAPMRALDAVRAGQEQGTGAGQAAEAVAFGDLVTGPVAQNLIRLFLATDALKRERRSAPADSDSAGDRRNGTRIQRVGVVGAGFMGTGIAQAAAVAGYSVRLRDLEPERVAGALRASTALTRSAARKGRLSRAEIQSVIDRLSGGTDYGGFGRVDLVIEAVFEDVGAKRAVIAELEDAVSPTAVIASNTSSLPIGGLAAGARRPERIVGMHFFSPVHRMPLLEVIRPDGASETAVATAIAAGRAMGKTVIVAGDGPGFYTTRVLALMLQEAGELFQQGAAIAAIDRAMTRFGFPVGPLALMDEVGIDLGAHIAGILHDAFPDRFRPAPALRRMVELGRLGRKSGRGFYDYRGQRKRPDPDVDALRSATPARLPEALIQRRLSLALINEAARCLEEGMIASARDGDVGAILGFGFPPFLGGPFRHVDTNGARVVVEQLRQLEYGYGEVFRPAPILRDLAARGAAFYQQ